LPAFTTSDNTECPIASYVATGTGITHVASGTGIAVTDRTITIPTTAKGTWTATYTITADGGLTTETKTVTLTVVCPTTVSIIDPPSLVLTAQHHINSGISFS
jgi:hypothetical protein